MTVTGAMPLMFEHRPVVTLNYPQRLKQVRYLMAHALLLTGLAPAARRQDLYRVRHLQPHRFGAGGGGGVIVVEEFAF